METQIHPTAVIADGAELDEGVNIGPLCVVGPKVKIGKGTRLISHVTVDGNTTLGENNELFPYACIGMIPQDLKYNGEETSLVVGSNNRIREYVTIHVGSVDGEGVTSVGDDNFFMAYVHIAHDCKLGNHIIMANYAGLSGHVTMEDHVVAGGLLGVHQFTRIGEYAMLGGVSRIIHDVPPYVIASGADKAKLYGLNLVGLKRNGFSDETISELKSAYRILFREKIPLGEAIKKIQEELPYSDKVRHLVEFVQANKRGICR
ncbi:MAG: acyl-ACP--UDP-N-acetylglucosamine O-acyltransferase [Thermodesulfovibrionales bacterium]|nr:acyl-ACP--UDP-N-acetylglucosamine O-acyltransferase [Thermodesulfovibrionales bacterium]